MIIELDFERVIIRDMKGEPEAIRMLVHINTPYSSDATFDEEYSIDEVMKVVDREVRATLKARYFRYSK